MNIQPVAHTHTHVRVRAHAGTKNACTHEHNSRTNAHKRKHTHLHAASTPIEGEKLKALGDIGIWPGASCRQCWAYL